MYAKYTTEGVVIRVRESGEHDRVCTIFTKEFGCITGRASSIRKESSRMRYGLVRGAACKVSLVRGKNGWRIAGSVALEQTLSVRAMHAYARVLSLVSRLVHGEEKNDYLYETLRALRTELAHAEISLGTIELIAVARILFALGYLSKEAVGESVLLLPLQTKEAHAYMLEERARVLEAVNMALTASHL